MVKYIQIRHWDYWWGVYEDSGAPAAQPWAAEFSLTDDEAGERVFFHFDLYNLPGLREALRQGDFLPEGHPDRPGFLRRAAALEQGASSYFIGALYYRDFTPDLELCGLPAEKGIPLLDLRSPPASPYCAVIFLAEERPLTPEVLTQWMEQLSRPLFGRAFACRIAHVPSRAEVQLSRLSDGGGN